MTDVLVGVDAGGTKVAFRVEPVGGGAPRDVIVPDASWDAEPSTTAAAWIRRVLDEQVLTGEDRVVALGLGAQGCDAPEVSAALTAALGDHGLPAHVVNDAALVVPAAGLDTGIGVIAGTGAIAVGIDTAGTSIAAGGWGWVLGDDGGATGIVREATRAVLLAADRGEPDDGLGAALLSAFGVTTTERLARTVNDRPVPEHWAPRAPAVFDAADAGSVSARAVIARAAEHLADLVVQLRRRDAVGQVVVAAGSVIVGRPALWEAFRTRVLADGAVTDVRLLTVPPVVGAVALARLALR